MATAIYCSVESHSNYSRKWINVANNKLLSHNGELCLLMALFIQMEASQKSKENKPIEPGVNILMLNDWLMLTTVSVETCPVTRLSVMTL